MGDKENNYKMIVSEYGKYRIITFENMNKVDLYNVKDLQALFTNGNQDGIEDWVLDLSLISHIDSSGLGGLANQARYLMKKSKRLIILSPNSGVKHLFAVTGFDKMFLVVSDKSMLP